MSARIVSMMGDEALGRGEEVLRRLRERLRAEGLHVVLPMGADAFDAISAAVGAPRLGELLEGARSAVLIGDGGGEFFARFRAATGSEEGTSCGNEAHPLDAFTRIRVAVAVREILDAQGIGFAVFHPFLRERVQLPFQRLGQAAGLPAPGPLGIQVHPTFGPWWAYRALVALSTTLAREAELGAACPSCARPCVNDCAQHASAPDRGARGGGTVSAGCGDGCGARRRCPVGVAYGYSDDQLAFHTRARRAAAMTSSS
jgi:hypothetical protein